MVQDKKRDYLIRTLSRTKRKDYENYIINAIYHKLDRLDIQPVTQQYVKRSDGKYALVDLYFPQLNYAIECDEAHHLGDFERDTIRTITMEEMLDSVEQTQDFKLRRIKAYESISSIEAQIKDVVTELTSLLEQDNLKTWNIEFDCATYAINKGKITVEDRLAFDKITTIARCFGKTIKVIKKAGLI